MFFTKVDTKNLKLLFDDRPRGNLYMRYRKKKHYSFVVVDGLSYDELYAALDADQIDLIWIEGPAITELVIIN